MTFWQRKDGRRVFVYYWCRETGKQKLIPRALTSHLDQMSDKAVESWISQWDGDKKILAHELTTIKDSYIVDLVNKFCAHQRDDLKRHPYTIQPHSRNLLYFALPFFFQKVPIDDIRKMSSHSIKLNYYLRDELQLPPSKIKNIQMSLRMFWRWLEEEGIVEGKLMLRRTTMIESTTPLKHTPAPDEILKWQSPYQDLTLLLLLAYFLSLRPQEIFALKPSDFIAGSLAISQEPSRVMRESSLFDRLLVKIVTQRSRRIGLTAPKAGSKGLVACFNETAARRIVEILKKLPRDDFIFPFGNDWYYKKWRRHGFPKLTLKDCRRASLYWLGHYTTLDIVALRNHARHSDIETTALYTRRPLFDHSLDTSSLELY